MIEESIGFEDDIVSVEEEVEILEMEGEESILTRAGRLVFYLFLVLFPVWFLPTSIAPVDLNKIYFAVCALLVSLMLTLGGVLQDGRIRFVSSRLFLLYIAFLISLLLSALFSASPLASLWGLGLETTTFASFAIAGIGLFLVPLVLQDEAHIRRALVLLAVSLVALALFFFVQSVLGIDIFMWSFAQQRSFNPFGGWNALALFFGFGIALLLPFINRGSLWSTLLFCALFIVSVLANFRYVWIALAVVSLFFVSLALSRREQYSRLFSISLALLLVATLFTLLNGVLIDYFSTRASGLGRPQELILSSGTTFELAQKSLADSPVLGFGPNTFTFVWNRFKDPDINRTPFWQARFNTGASAFLTTVVEGGVLAAVLFLLLVFVFLWNGIRALGAGSDEQTLPRASFAGVLFLIIAWFLYPVNFALVLLTFVMLGIFYSALRAAGLADAKEVFLFETKERGFVFSLFVIILLIGGVGGIYYETMRYFSLLSFGRGIDVYNTTGAINGAEQEIERAISYDSLQDRYFRTYAQLEQLKAQRALGNQSIDQKERSDRFQASYNRAVAFARAAIDLGKSEPDNYRALGQAYELAIPVDPSIADLALENYEKAQKLSPADPSIFIDMARTHLAFADVTLIRGGGSTSQKIASERREKSIELLEKVIALKPDYTQAHFTLSQLYVVQGRIDEAIRSAEQTTLLAPNDIGVLFQLGLLQYRKDNLDQARTALEKAVALNSDYSNAKYFLGLIYDREERPQDALRLFEEIAALNPANQEVQNILTSLRSGKKAADVLTKPPPEERRVTPLKDDKSPEESPREIQAL